MSHRPESYYTIEYKKNGEGKLVLASERRIAPESEKIYRLLIPCPIERAGKLPYTLFLAGETHCRPDYYCHFHSASHACLMHFESGAGTLRVNKKEYKVRAGDTVLMREGNDWEYKTDRQNPWHLHWVNLSHESCLGLLALYEMPPCAVFSDPDLGLTVKKIVNEIKTNSRYAQTRDSVMQHLLHSMQCMGLSLANRRNSKKQARDAYIMMDYINSHIMENIRVSDLSKLVFRSAGGAANAFRAIYNCSIKDYILRAKLETAAHLLRENEHQVSEIAEMLTFCDAQHFSRMFRIRYGMSPTHFRKLFRTGGEEALRALEHSAEMSFDDIDIDALPDDEED